MSQDAVTAAVPPLVVQVGLIKRHEIICVLRPHKGKGLIILMKGRVKRCECVEAANLPVQFGYFEFLLHLKRPGDEP